MRLQRYIFRLLAGNFLMVLVVVTGIVFLIVLMQLMGRDFDASFSQILARVPFFLPPALKFAIPISILISSMLTFGRLSADNEILAIRMGGIHPFHALSPAILLALALAVVTLLLNMTAAPLSEGRLRQITKDDLRRLFDSFEARRVNGFQSDRMQMSWQSAEEDGSLSRVDFHFAPKDMPPVSGYARRARVMRDELSEELTFAFYDLTVSRGDGEDEHRAAQETIRYPIVSLFGEETDTNRKDLLTSEELLYRFLKGPLIGKRQKSALLTRYRTEYYGRIAMALACLVFVLVGAPAGVLMRRGSFAASAVGGVVAFVLYYLLHEGGRNLAAERAIDPALAMAVPDCVLAVAGLVLLNKVLSR